MKIHIIGICGTFMGGVALLARELGHQVSGSDENVYPPMSTLLEEQGITIKAGYAADNINDEPELVIIGNAMSRGNPEVEAVLDRGLQYTSGAQWLSENVLSRRWTVAVAGTHGKTTTSSMVAWILEAAGLSPGFLIGGIPMNFGVSARLGKEPFFVIEADEYDTAFFDKRSKFVHYRPRTAVLNNLEFDHADIFNDLEEIKVQFHHLVRTVPASGRLLINKRDSALQDVLQRGCWSESEYFDDTNQWHAKPLSEDCASFEVFFGNESQGQVHWQLIGEHNMQNALAAIAAVRHAGVASKDAVEALCEFKNAKRRLEVRYDQKGIRLYDDFAHHPTEIAATLKALRQNVGTSRVIAVLEPRSNTMRMGIHQDALADALVDADLVEIYQTPGTDWDLTKVASKTPDRVNVSRTIDDIVSRIADQVKSGDHVVVMSNGGFGGIHDKLISQISG